MDEQNEKDQLHDSIDIPLEHYMNEKIDSSVLEYKAITPFL